MPEDITLRTIQIDEKPLIYSLERRKCICICQYGCSGKKDRCVFGKQSGVYPECIKEICAAGTVQTTTEAVYQRRDLLSSGQSLASESDTSQ